MLLEYEGKTPVRNRAVRQSISAAKVRVSRNRTDRIAVRKSPSPSYTPWQSANSTYKVLLHSLEGIDVPAKGQTLKQAIM